MARRKSDVVMRTVKLTAARRRQRARAAYTLVEVMMAVAVMTIGATGILAMQQASTSGNLEARQLTTAIMVAERWIERLKRESSLYWTTQVASPVDFPAPAVNIRRVVPTAPQWNSPVATMANESMAFDFWGRDTVNAADQTFCAQTRLQWVYVGAAMRADVRVWWHRRGSGDAGQYDARLYRAPLCGQGAENAMTGDPRLKFVYASTVLRWAAPNLAP